MLSRYCGISYRRTDGMAWGPARRGTLAAASSPLFQVASTDTASWALVESLYFFGKQSVARNLLKSRVINGDSRLRSSFISQVSTGSNWQVLFNEELISFSTSSAVTVFHPLMTWLAVSAPSFGGMAEVAERMESTLSEKTWQSHLQCSRCRHIDRLAFHPCCRTLSATISSSFPCFQQSSHASDASPCDLSIRASPSVVWPTPAGQHPRRFFCIAVRDFWISSCLSYNRHRTTESVERISAESGQLDSACQTVTAESCRTAPLSHQLISPAVHLHQYRAGKLPLSASCLI